jgi:hypothetical protein
VARSAEELPAFEPGGFRLSALRRTASRQVIRSMTSNRESRLAAPRCPIPVALANPFRSRSDHSPSLASH